jgi:hypothetical protein
VELTTAVALAAMLGPSQVGVRLIEMAFGRHYHPIWTLISAAGLMAVGIGLLAIGVPLIAPAVITYGGGVGIAWIARGTVPLALLGPTDYAVRMGRLALPSLIAQAFRPRSAPFSSRPLGLGPLSLRSSHWLSSPWRRLYGCAAQCLRERAREGQLAHLTTSCVAVSQSILADCFSTQPKIERH